MDQSKLSFKYSDPLIVRRISLNGYSQNYNDSEAIARRSGVLLADRLRMLRASHNNLNIFAHSMGNVVVSEALRNANAGERLVETYVPSQAAEVGSAYSQTSSYMRLGDDADPGDFLANFIDGEFPRSARGIEEAWRTANVDSIIDSDFDMPPNQYTYSILAPHGPTLPVFESNDPAVISRADPDPERPQYYSNISQAAGNIVNFYNPRDSALAAWEINQITKPDGVVNPAFFSLPAWEYDYVEFSADSSRVIDVYSVLRLPFLGIPERESLTWSRSAPITDDAANILSHIIPARSGALGQSPELGALPNSSVISSDESFSNFGGSNQGHSTHFYRSFAMRSFYWSTLLATMGFEVPN